MAKIVPGPVPPGNIVRDYQIGKARVIICSDAYINRSREEQRESFGNIGRIWGEAEQSKIFQEALRCAENKTALLRGP